MFIRSCMEVCSVEAPAALSMAAAMTPSTISVAVYGIATHIFQMNQVKLISRRGWRRYAFKVARGDCINEGAHHKYERYEEDDLLRLVVVLWGSIRHVRVERSFCGRGGSFWFSYVWEEASGRCSPYRGDWYREGLSRASPKNRTTTGEWGKLLVPSPWRLEWFSFKQFRRMQWLHSPKLCWF